jgi:hypothetical protein
MRGFLMTIVLGAGVFAGVAWHLDFLPDWTEIGKTRSEGASDRAGTTARELGPMLYPSAPLVRPAINPMGARLFKDPIVTLGHNVILERQEVPSKRAGQLLFIGDRIPDGAPIPAGAYKAKIFQGGQAVEIPYRRLEEGALVNEDQMVALDRKSVV